MEPHLGCILLIWTVALAPAAAARAETPVRLHVVGELPFPVEALEQAVRARIPLAVSDDATPVVVGPVGETGLLLRVAGRTRTLGLNDRGEALSPRVVALAIADLASARTEREDSLQVTAPPRVDERRPAARLAAALDASKGLGAAEPPTYGLLVDLLGTPRLLPGWARLGASLGVWMVPTQRPLRVDRASLNGLAARFWFGWGANRLSVLFGPFALPYSLDGEPSIARSGLLVGAGGMLRFEQPIGGRVRLLATLRADGFANRIEVSIGSESASLATPRVAVAASAGIAWEVAP